VILAQSALPSPSTEIDRYGERLIGCIECNCCGPGSDHVLGSSSASAPSRRRR